MDKKLADKIDKFLEIRNISNNDDYSSCSKDDIQTLYEIFNDIINAKFDRDYPIELSIINKTTHESIRYLPIRYMHKTTTEDEINDIIEIAGVNVSIASEKLNQLLKIRKYQIERVKLLTSKIQIIN
jgi:hypothetical protein